jgi:hypothetical protein
MSERPGDRVQELFDRAVALPPARRAAFLAATCADEPALHAEVESLLACDVGLTQDGGDGGLLKSPLVRAPELTISGSDGPLPAARAPGPASPAIDHPASLPAHQGDDQNKEISVVTVIIREISTQRSVAVCTAARGSAQRTLKNVSPTVESQIDFMAGPGLDDRWLVP